MNSDSVEILFSVHEYDEQGDIVDTGIFLQIGDIIKIKIAKNMKGLQEVIDQLDSIWRLFN